MIWMMDFAAGVVYAIIFVATARLAKLRVHRETTV